MLDTKTKNSVVTILAYYNCFAYRREDIKMVVTMDKLLKLRPKCGFCNVEIKELPQMTEDGVTLFCCPECGAVLGIVKEK